MRREKRRRRSSATSIDGLRSFVRSPLSVSPSSGTAGTTRSQCSSVVRRRNPSGSIRRSRRRRCSRRPESLRCSSRKTFPTRHSPSCPGSVSLSWTSRPARGVPRRSSTRPSRTVRNGKAVSRKSRAGSTSYARSTPRSSSPPRRLSRWRSRKLRHRCGSR